MVEPSVADSAQQRPGRKRCDRSRLSILSAAWELVSELGYAGLSVEGIAARAGTGKQTIYRWWPSKADVLVDALTAKAGFHATADLHIVLEDRGSYADDLRAFLRASLRLARDPVMAGVLRTLMAQAQIDPSFGARFRDGFLQARREAVRVLVDRARDRGDLPTGQTSDTAATVVFGVVWYEILAVGEAKPHRDEDLVDDLVALLAAPRHEPH
ncbi:TetR/AcrR family transcriptional regulator [Amycolatopsis pithecellobii]|uniref:TetR family transcriptional regulator n=1 Tax=Amycolatopsis pithecellobii TaxID=664692 RepID=A0A6N7YUR2_9PSEU|nr:TetR/AcrR family transcriptional regulator [Amycolatopsis pithecellobii]MTD56805.1 TetR family transcriptional regulator [Amycolatopsis pithecellobii]